MVEVVDVEEMIRSEVDLTRKSYIVKVNVVGRCWIKVEKVVKQLGDIGEMVNIGEQRQEMMVMKYTLREV
ncbi:hypothetical protein, partial [Staphylococcus capitis]|uniref:hypothetical protein n=1 Tax=Staphylococcus capitis TaxID=29388 RepID=UPI0011A7509D